MTQLNVNYKNTYTGIFALNYFTQGVNQSIVAIVIPIYLLNLLTTIDGSAIGFLASISLAPWAIKFLFGILSDKYGTKKLGRRKPYITLPISLGGLIWIIVPFLITANNAIILFTIAGFLINIGTAMGDTAIDGMILDLCPEEKLGKTQGTCWSFRSLGSIVGGPFLAFSISFIPAEFIFIILGVMMMVFSALVLFIKEKTYYEDVEIAKNLKLMFTNKRNWKVYGFAFLNAIVDGVIVLYVSLYVLVQWGLVGAQGASISLLEENINLYFPQAIVAMVIGIGVIFGALIGGYLSDEKSRKLAVYSSFLVTSAALLLMLLPVTLWLLFILSAFLGSTWGWRNSAYSAVAGEVSKQYPEMDSTYFSICNSFANFGTTLGISIVGMIFAAAKGFTGDIYELYIVIFITMAVLQNLGIIFFVMLDPKEYEYKLSEQRQKLREEDELTK
ncbi:MAG: MFS transporter [Promethearchaeia archaeon]